MGDNSIEDGVKDDFHVADTKEQETNYKTSSFIGGSSPLLNVLQYRKHAV